VLSVDARDDAARKGYAQYIRFGEA
jgi:hypothetical protein